MTDTSGGLPPAGWYPDPYGAPHERWWDGQEWTEHTNAATAAAPASMPAEPAPVEPIPVAEMPAFAEPASQPTYEQPAYSQPGYEQPSYEQPAYEQPVFEQPAYEQPSYEQAAYEQPVFEQPGYAQPGYAQPGFEQATYEQQGFAQPVAEQSPYDQPSYGQPAFEQPVFEQPAFEQPVNQQPVWNEPVQEQPASWAPQAAQEQQQAAPWPPQSNTEQAPGAAWSLTPETAVPAASPFTAPAAPAAPAAPSYGDLFATPTAGAQPNASVPNPSVAPAVSASPAFSASPAVSATSAAQPFAASTASGGVPDFGQLITGGDTVDPFGSWASDDYVEPPRNGAATAALVFGVLSFLLSGVTGILGVVFGAVGLARSGKLRRESGAAVGRGKAVAGIVLSIVGSAATAAAAVFLVPSLLAGTSATNGASPSGTDDGPVKTANGNIEIAVGEQGVIKDADGNAAITFTVTSIQPDPTCTAPEEDQLSAENGQFIAVGLTFETSPTYVSVMSTEAPMQINSADWVGYSPDGTELLNSDAGLTCLTAAEQVPIDIAAGGTTTGTYVLDLATGATSISWAPSDVTSVTADQLRWEWLTVASQ